ncbi:DUF4320 family protein [Bacteroides heparinolyticus]|uniref:DUF4320 family protein n=1 Tax=Prevotella heparinolytica TaxID=28113 RepID=UPI00359F6C37
MEKKKYLKRRRGSVSQLEIMIGFVLILALVVALLKFVPVIITKQKLDSFAGELIRYVEVRGRTDVSGIEEELRSRYGINPKITYRAVYYKDRKVQIDDKIEVVLELEVKYSAFGVSTNIKLSTIRGGRSEVYWK